MLDAPSGVAISDFVYLATTGEHGTRAIQYFPFHGLNCEDPARKDLLEWGHRTEELSHSRCGDPRAHALADISSNRNHAESGPLIWLSPWRRSLIFIIHGGVAWTADDLQITVELDSIFASTLPRGACEDQLYERLIYSATRKQQGSLQFPHDARKSPHAGRSLWRLRVWGTCCLDRRVLRRRDWWTISINTSTWHREHGNRYPRHGTDGGLATRRIRCAECVRVVVAVWYESVSLLRS